MTRWTHHLVRYGTLTLVTVFAIGVMAYVSMRDDAAAQQALQQVTTPVPVVAQPKPLVAAERVKASLHEVTAKFSGKIRPWETYSVGFEQPGRIVELGVGERGEPLDDGSRVKQGQTLARIDDRILRARLAEATANLEQASSDLERARELRSGAYETITKAEFQGFLTAHSLAQAALAIATKNLEDAELKSPVNATISRRMAEPGEVVPANQTVFDLVQNDDMLLVVDVPESQIRELQSRMRAVRSAEQTGTNDAESRVFRARVNLESRDRFGRELPPIDAEVYRIAELADPRTGLFEVEIRVPNETRLLRAGMVATADVVIDRISAYRVPELAVLFREDQTYLFGLDEVDEPLQVMFWQVDEVPVATARRIELSDWIDQGDYLLVPSTTAKLDRIIVRGQQRLSDGQHVRVTDESADTKQQYVAPDGKDEKVAQRSKS